MRTPTFGWSARRMELVCIDANIIQLIYGSHSDLLEWSHKNLGSATSHLFFLICISFRFATELALKLLRLLPECSNFSSHPILHLSSQDMNRREHSALLRLCQYVFPHVKPPWQPPNHFHLLLQIPGMHCQIICRPFQLFLLLEELSNIT